MKFRIEGTVVKVIKEYSVVNNGVTIICNESNDDATLIRKINSKIIDIVGDFYTNHYVIELKSINGCIIYIGINDENIYIGSNYTTYGEERILEPLNNENSNLYINHKN